MIEVENLCKRYGETLAAGGLDVVVRPGVVTGFLGPDGAGQPVTMRVIAGLDEPAAGQAGVTGLDYRAAAAPMAELGGLLEATALPPDRPAANHFPRVGAWPRQRIRSLV
jgi:ABC-2 type transport system ATP-binding protein